MRKTKLFALVGSICLILALVVALSGGSAPATADKPAPEDSPGLAKEVLLPPDVMPVVYMSGTPYQMGYQYGQQAEGYIKMMKNGVWSQVLAQYENDKARITDMLAEYETYIKDETPEFIEIMQGIADGAGLEYEDILMITCHLEVSWNPPVGACSCISAWGSATEDGEAIAGANFDYPWNPFSYRVIVVVYPSEGNSYISTACAGMMGNNFFMNDKGLVNLSNYGEFARPEDHDYGLPTFVIAPHISMSCDTAEEARDLLLPMSKAEGIYRHFVDVNGDAYAVESTSALVEVREPGDFGEQDYLITTNHWIIPEMAVSKFDIPRPGSSEYRYMTAEKLLQEGHGDLDLSSFMDVLGSVDYWDGKHWHYDAEWSGIVIDNYFGPGGTTTSQIAVPADKTVYIRTGDGDGDWGTGAPFLTGEFVKLTLEGSPASVTATAAATAVENLCLAAQALDESPSLALSDKLNQAKVVYWEGLAYEAEAGLAEDQDTALELYGKATTCFCKAQAYALQVAHGAQ